MDEHLPKAVSENPIFWAKPHKYLLQRKSISVYGSCIGIGQIIVIFNVFYEVVLEFGRGII
jgi:hypothetical protein